MRLRLEGVLHKYHEDHIALKGMNSRFYYNLVRKFIPKPQAFTMLDAKAAVEKERKFWKRYRHGS